MVLITNIVLFHWLIVSLTFGKNINLFLRDHENKVPMECILKSTASRDLKFHKFHATSSCIKPKPINWLILQQWIGFSKIKMYTYSQISIILDGYFVGSKLDHLIDYFPVWTSDWSDFLPAVWNKVLPVAPPVSTKWKLKLYSWFILL